MRIDPFLQAHRLPVITVAALLPALACALLTLVRDSVANTNAALVLVLLVVAAAATGIRAAGLAAAMSGAVWFDFFLTAPFQSFAVADRADIETAALLVLVGVAVSEIAVWGRRQQARASCEQGYLEGVLGTVAAVSGGGWTSDALVDHVCRQVVEVLGIDGCRFARGAVPALATLDGDAAMTYAGRAYRVDRWGLPTDAEITVAVRSGGVLHGHLLLTAATRIVRPSREQLRVVGALAHQLGAALAADPAADAAAGAQRA